ncbi:MAG: fructose-6-phosphate aldolase [Acidobacteria bacterium]|nr:fructose-6-phosphate aldolase [Acidobacteriota bacterium]
MKFFLDTANLNEIREAARLGVLDGVTTNPSLVAKEGNIDFRDHLAAICEIVDGPVNGEVVSLDTEGMLREGHELVKIHKNIVVKLPTTAAGIRACKALSDEGIKTNMTLVFSAPQALIVAKAGAAYVSPFVGRLDDIGQDGMELIAEIVDIYGNYNFSTEVLVASIRHPIHITQAARMGADIATMPYKVIEQLLKHPLTDIGLEKFLKDWEATQGAANRS